MVTFLTYISNAWHSLLGVAERLPHTYYQPCFMLHIIVNCNTRQSVCSLREMGCSLLMCHFAKAACLDANRGIAVYVYRRFLLQQGVVLLPVVSFGGISYKVVLNTSSSR